MTRDPEQLREQRKAAQRRARQRQRLIKAGLPIPPELASRQGGRPAHAEETAREQRQRSQSASVIRRDRQRKRVRQLLAINEPREFARLEAAKHEAAVRALIDAADVAAVAQREIQPTALRLLLADVRPYGRAFVDCLEGGPLLPVRVMRGLQLGKPHKTYTRAQTVGLLRRAMGRKAEIIRGILTGSGHPSAVLLRRLAESIRGASLPIYDLSEGAARDPDEFLRRSEATKRAAKTRKARQQHCSEGPDELEPRVGYRERLSLEGVPQ